MFDCITNILRLIAGVLQVFCMFNKNNLWNTPINFLVINYNSLENDIFELKNYQEILEEHNVNQKLIGKLN